MAGRSVPVRPEVLVGHDEELAEVRAALTAGGCFVAGAVGVGKTRLAAAASTLDGAPVVRIVATEAAATMPFGAFGHVLPAIGEVAAQVPDVVAALARAGADGALVVWVDDAHLLDDASAAAVLAVAEAGAARLLVTVRTPSHPPDAVAALWKDRGVTRIDLLPLAVAETRKIIESTLHAPVHTSVPERVHALAQGNPLYTTELLGAAVRDGALTQVDGRWHLASDRLELGHLRELVGAHLRTVSDEARAALELLAVGGPLALEHVEALCSSDAVEELEGAHLAVIVEDDDRGAVVELAHPLHGEVVSAGLTVTAGRRHRRALADLLQTRGKGTPGDQVRIATWLLESGTVDRELCLQASRTATAQGAPALAGRLAEAAAEDGDLESAVVVATAWMGDGRWDEAADLLARCEEAARDAPPGLAAEYVVKRLRTLHRGSKPCGAARAFLDSATPWGAGQEWDTLVSSQRAWVALYEAQPIEAMTHAESVVHDPDAAALARFEAAGAAVYAYARLGRSAECDALEGHIDELSRSHDGWEAGAARIVVDAVGRTEVYVDCAGVAGRMGPVLDWAIQAGDRPLARLLRHTIADTLFRRGHALAALELLEQVRDTMDDGLTLNTEPVLLTDLMTVYALLGRNEDAQAASSELDERLAFHPYEVVRWAVRIGQARGLVEHAAGRHSMARDQLLEVAATAGDDLQGAADALYAALRFGASARSCGQSLRSIADAGSNPVLTLWARHAEALAAADGAALLDVATSFEAAGLDLFAAEAATSASTLLQDAGRRDSARRATALVTRCIERCPEVVSAARSAAAGSRPLSARELECAMLAARGRTNAEIAEELLLGIRTVETHVLNACRKLGASNRRELRHLLDGAG